MTKDLGDRNSAAEILIPDRVLNGLFLVEVVLILLAADGFRRVIGQLALVVPEAVSFVVFAVVAFGLRGGARMLLPRSAAYFLGAFTAPVVKLLGYIITPFVWTFAKLTNLVGLLLRAGRRAEAVAPDAEFFELYAAETGAELEEEEKEMIEAIISIRATRAREVMVPRVDIVAVPETATVNEIKALVVKHGYSRLPVFRENVDDVIGILHAKDLFVVEGTGVDVISLLRKPYYVPDSKKVNEILTELQEHKTQMAIVVDEYGGTAGVITLEDVIEEIVGEIHDEYDAEEFTFEKSADGSYRVNAKMDLEELSEELGIEIAGEDFETLGGFIIAQEGQVPAEGEVLDYENLEITVLESDERRVSSVRIKVKPPTEEAAGE
ncbi:MAG: HlyC/CorC family transporter [Candidatus Coatesbacteria bacterium]|nr:MAG: HlyC/CorC family transporter [Candidatus Coatesbacteria bacterium]